MTLQFDPNTAPGPKAKLWATYIPDRSPKFKPHTNIGQAKNAIGYGCDWGQGAKGRPAIMYQWANEQWVEVDRFDASPLCDHCGQDYKTRPHTVTHDNPAYNRVDCRLHRLHESGISPVWKKPRVCSVCYHTHFDRYNKNLTHRIPVDQVGLVDRPEGMNQ